MNINATVFVQALNFGLTYFYLKKILFKPIFQRIQQKERAKETLNKTLKEKEQNLLRLKNEKIEQLIQFRLYLKKYYELKQTQQQEIPTTLVYQKNEARLNTLTQQGTTLLIEKVPYAY
jgi:NADH dehydrogenase/NADH:ubiquinone oxidoreductase subunit G